MQKQNFKKKEDLKAEINIIDYALVNGYKIDKEKTTLKSVKLDNVINGDRIIVEPKKALYFNIDYPNDKGDILQFASNRIHGFLSVDTSNEAFYNALVTLNKHLGNHLNNENKNTIADKDKFLAKKEKLASLQDAQWNHKPMEDYSYLTKERAIDLNTLKQPIFEGRLFNTFFKLKSGHLITNFAFGTYTNDQLTGLEVRNKTIKSIMGDHNGVFYSNVDKTKPIDGVFYAESAIDLASAYELLQQNTAFDTSKNYLFMSFSGNLYESKMNHILEDLSKLKITPQTKFVSLTDTDLDKDENKKKGKDYDVLFTAAILNKYNTPVSFSSNDVYYNYNFTQLSENTKTELDKIIVAQNNSIESHFSSEERFGKFLMIKENTTPEGQKQTSLFIPKSIDLELCQFRSILKSLHSEHRFIPHKPKLVGDWNDELKRRKGLLVVQKKNITLTNEKSNTNLKPIKNAKPRI
jgi:hypothetical protein